MCVSTIFSKFSPTEIKRNSLFFLFCFVLLKYTFNNLCENNFQRQFRSYLINLTEQVTRLITAKQMSRAAVAMANRSVL